jgi:hypothetical protein
MKLTYYAFQIISIVKSRNTKDKTFGNLAFACGYVMLLVTNQVCSCHRQNTICPHVLLNSYYLLVILWC